MMKKLILATLLFSASLQAAAPFTAEQLGIQGTPATLIGDQMLSGWVPYEQFEAMVGEALKNAKS